MKLMLREIGACALLAAAVGCSAKPLQPDPGGGTGTGGIQIGIDGGRAGTGGAFGMIDGGTVDAPFAGRRSFVVSSELTAVEGAPLSTSSHAFTMVVDGDNLNAIIGANGWAVLSPIQPLTDGFRVLAFGLPLATTGCSTTITYSDLTFRFDAAGRLLGSGSGQLTTAVTDVASSVAVTASLTGTADTVAPALALTAGDLTDPFTSFSVVSPEPLPTMIYPSLRAAGGDSVVLTAAAPSGGYTSAFNKPSVLLRFGEQYTVDLTGLSDFAGNAAVVQTAGGVLTFTTRAAPPLVAADGFESVTGATLGGGQVLSATAGDPTITGTRSLYLPPANLALTVPPPMLTLRLGVVPGANALRFSYRLVNPGPVTNMTFVAASVGGPISTIVPALEGTTTTPMNIAGQAVTVGPVSTATIGLQPGTTDEIVLERAIQWGLRSCGPAYLSAPGIIIDDLRTE
jgi:hypothetical protein